VDVGITELMLVFQIQKQRLAREQQIINGKSTALNCLKGLNCDCNNILCAESLARHPSVHNNFGASIADTSIAEFLEDQCVEYSHRVPDTAKTTVNAAACNLLILLI
jgi:hypothetical protein